MQLGEKRNGEMLQWLLSLTRGRQRCLGIFEQVSEGCGSKRIDGESASDVRVRIKARISHFVITNQPDTRCLIVLIIGDHYIICSYLQ